MTLEMRVGLVTAFVLHATLFYGFAGASLPQYEVIVAPSSLEVSLVAAQPRLQPEPPAEEKDKIKEIKESKEVQPLKKVQPREETKKPVAEIIKESIPNSLRGVVTQVEPLAAQNKPPKYPRVARVKGYEGTVVLQVWVSAEGMARRVEIKKTSGYKMLDQSALRAIRKWRFTPASRLGFSVPAQVEIPVIYLLENPA